MMRKPVKSRPQPIEGARARRFDIRAPVLYRTDDGIWHRGTTENISHSGLLLRTEASLTVNSRIEMIVDLASARPADLHVSVLCRGRVVRADTPLAPAGPIVAAAITHYCLRREGS
jgi:hypothetical protein